MDYELSRFGGGRARTEFASVRISGGYGGSLGGEGCNRRSLLSSDQKLAYGRGLLRHYAIWKSLRTTGIRLVLI